MITIEKNIPIPSPRQKHQTMPLGKMEVGDSFQLITYELKIPCVQKLALRVSNALTKYSTKLCGKKKFTLRTINKTTVRIWRIK